MAQVDPDQYVHGVLGPSAAKASAADSEPQLPASIMIGQALVESGFDDSNMQGNSVFNIRYNTSISEGPPFVGKDGAEWCTFPTMEGACKGYIKNMKGGYYKDAVACLKPKLLDSTMEDKLKYLSLLLPIYAPSSDGNRPAEYYNQVVEFINQYDLLKYDDPKMANQKIDETLAAQISAGMGGGGNGTGGKGKYGVGFDRKVAGQMVCLTRLPKGKTNPCEPIYPDLVTVSDTVPKWVLDATVVEVNKQAEEEYNKKHGIVKKTDAKKKPEEIAKEKCVEEYNKVSQEQFVKWLVDNGHGYNSAESFKQCQDMYAQAAAADDGSKFTDGVYYAGDADSKTRVEKIAKEKKSYDDADAKKAQESKDKTENKEEKK